MAVLDFSVEFDRRQLNRLLKLSGDPKLIGNLVKAGLRDTGRFAVRRISFVAPRDRGWLAKSYRFLVDRRRIPTFLEIFSKIGYAPFVEFGAKAHFPPPAALKGWAGRHGFPPSPRGEFMVAQAIAFPKPGALSLVGQPHVIPTMNRVIRTMPRMFARAMKQMESVWTRG